MTSDTSIAKPASAVSAQALGIFLALLGAALFATKGIIIKLALADGIDTLTTLAWRQVVAVPVFVTVGVLGYRRRLREAPAGAAPVLDTKTLFQALGVGILGYYVASLLDFSGLAYITAQLDRLILLTYPFFVVAFGMLFFRRRITRLMVVSLLVSYAGIVIIFARDFSVEGDNVVLGSLLVFGSALAYAGYQVLAKPLIDHLGPPLFTSVAMSGAGPAVLVHFIATRPIGAMAINGQGLWLMLAIGLVATVAPAYCISTGIGLIGPERTAIIGNVSPLVTVGLSISILGEAFTIWHAAGTAMVLLGVWLFGRKGKPKAVKIEA